MKRTLIVETPGDVELNLVFICITAGEPAG
jgi:hypothetical protein